MAKKKSQSLQKELSLREEIILINARRIQLTNQLDRMKTGNLIERIKAGLDEIEAATKAEDEKAMKAAMQRVGKLINQGTLREQIWQEIYALIDRKVQLVEAESTRQLAERYRVFQEAMPELMARFDEILDVYILDPDVRQKIQAKLQELFGVLKGDWDNPYEA